MVNAPIYTQALNSVYSYSITILFVVLALSNALISIMRFPFKNFLPIFLLFLFLFFPLSEFWSNFA